MSADAYVRSTRLRAPSSLSSQSSVELKRLRLSSASIRILTSAIQLDPQEEHDQASSLHLRSTQNNVHLLRPQNGSIEVTTGLNGTADQIGGSKSEGQPWVTWLDLDRYEDWEMPRLDILRPDVRVQDEGNLFPIALAEDGETLPSDLHPSHPYGDLHCPTRAYLHKMKAWPVNVDAIMPSIQEMEKAWNSEREKRSTSSEPDHCASGCGNERCTCQPMSTKLRARQTVAINDPHWPFKRFGPGRGGPNSLLRNDLQRPWRPYRNIWADLGSFQ